MQVQLVPRVRFIEVEAMAAMAEAEEALLGALLRLPLPPPPAPPRPRL
jgi:hypothetical protein